MIIKIKNTSPPVFFVGRREESEFVIERFPDAVVYELENSAIGFMMISFIARYGTEEITVSSSPTYSVFNGEVGVN